MDFAKQCQTLGVELSPLAQEMLNAYYEMLVEWKNRFNLTAITDRDSVYQKHFADSLAGLRYLQGKVVDVGAGAGFPSIPCAIAGDADFTLIDSVNKKVGFLAAVAQQLGLSKVRAIHARAEEVGQGSMRESFDVATARAVAPLPTLLEYLAPLVKVGGKVVVYKTDAAKEQELAAHAAKVLHLDLVETYEYTIEDAARVVMVYAKTASCPKQYPRSGNKPRTLPL